MAIKIVNSTNLVVQASNSGIPEIEIPKNSNDGAASSQSASASGRALSGGETQQPGTRQRVGPGSPSLSDPGTILGSASRSVMSPTLSQAPSTPGTGTVRGSSPRTRPSESPRTGGLLGTSAGSPASSAGATIRDIVSPSGQTDDSVLMPDRTVGTAESAIQSLNTTIGSGITLGNGNDLISDIPPIENEIPTELFEFNKSIYDSEISQIGVISANPEIIGFLPLTNLYKNASEQSNMGVIYDLQNSLRDSTIKRAQEIVDSYFSANPVQKSTIQSLRQQNISKYSIVSSSIPKIIRLKMATIAVTKIAGAASDIQLKVDGFIATTDAEKRVSSGLVVDITSLTSTIQPEIDTTSSDSIDGIRSVEYVDGDVTKYDSGTSIVEKLKAKLIGTTNTIQPGLSQESQLNTTLQYQLMKASIAQIFEGRNFNQASVGSYYESPYQSLSYQKIASISGIISDNISMKTGFPFARVTIQEIAYFMQNSYDIKTAVGAEEFVENLKNSSIYFAGSIISDGTSIRPAYNTESPDYESETYMIGYDRSRYNLPIVGIDSSVKNDEFFNQIAPMLASQVAEIKIGSFFENLPDSINFRSEIEPNVVDTLSDPLRYAVQTNTSRNIFIFDETLPTTEGSQSDPISSIVLRTPDELDSIQTQLSEVNSNFSSFLKDRKFYFSNQCALTILKTFYEKFSNVLGTSFLNKNSDEITEGDFTPACFAMFFAATENSFASAKLHKIVSDAFSIPRALAEGRATGIDVAEYAAQFSLTQFSVSDGRLETTTEFDFGSFHLDGVGQKNKIQYTIEGSSGQEVAQKLFSTDSGIFNMFKEILDSLSSFGESETNILSQIEYSAYIFFLRILENMKISGKYVSGIPSVEFGFDVNISWYPADIAILVDCLNSAFTATSAKDVVYTNFSNIVGSNPSSEQKEKIDELLQVIRSPIKSTLQIYQDFRSLAGYQKTIIESQLTNISSINSLQTKVIEAYGGDERASQILGRYLTFESAVESLYKTSRYLTFVPNTRISTVATRSNHYRSIVKAAFKEVIPNKEDLKLCIVGMPYGNIESLRLALQNMDLFYDVKISADPAINFLETDTRINYTFPYDTVTRSSNSSAAGPFGSEFPGLYDDFDLNTEVDSTEDDSISIYKISESGSSLDIFQRDEVGIDEKNIDFPVSIVQAALQSYVEDIYGLYPRYSSTKISTRQDAYPEETYADAALSFAGVLRDTDDERLIYSRLKSVIMMHEDFMSTRILEEFEASPVFDKIVYLVVDGSLITDIVSQFYARVSVEPKQIVALDNAEIYEYFEDRIRQQRELGSAFDDAVARSSPYFSGVDIKTLVLDASKNVQNLQTLVGPITELQVKDLANGNIDVFANATDFYGGKYGYTQVNYLNLSNVARDTYSSSSSANQIRNLSNQSRITNAQSALTSTTRAENVVDVSVSSNVSRAASTVTNLIRNINTRRR